MTRSSRIIQLQTILWIWFLLASSDPTKATAISTGLPLRMRTGGDLKSSPSSTKDLIREKSTNSPCRYACHQLAEIVFHSEEEDDGNRMAASKAEKRDGLSSDIISEMTYQSATTESTSPNQLATKDSAKTRGPRSVSYVQPEMNHNRNGRGGNLGRNFLRFGRNGLTKNFLRFGRGDLRQNFLRFGRSGDGGDLPPFSSKDEVNFPSDGNNSNRDGNQNGYRVDYDYDAGKERHLTDRLENSNSQADENGGASSITNSPSSSSQSDPIDQQSELGDGNDQYKTQKRGSLRQNFIRFGRYYANVFSGKRGSLNRNFLRFGKRAQQQQRQPQQSFREELGDADAINRQKNKGSRDDEINFIRADDLNQLYTDNESPRIKRMVPQLVRLNKSRFGDHQIDMDTNRKLERRLTY